MSRAEAGKVRNIVDITGYLLVPKVPEATNLPRQKKVIPVSLFDEAHEAAVKTKGLSYEKFAARLYGSGNIFWRAAYDQDFNWQTVDHQEIERLLNEKENWVERAAKSMGVLRLKDPKWLPKWAPRTGTIIDLDEFDLDKGRVNMLTNLKNQGQENTIVSGNSYWTRRPLVNKLGKDTLSATDSELSLILPPHYGVDSGSLKIGTGVRARENGEIVVGHDDDYLIALYMSSLGRVLMSVDKKTAQNQPHVDGMLKQSGFSGYKESNIEFAKAA